MKRVERQDNIAIQIRLNIIFLIIAILCLLSINVRSDDLGSLSAKTGIKVNVAATPGEWKFENEAGVPFGEAEFKKMVQPGKMFLIRLDINNKPIDLLNKDQFNMYVLKNVKIVPLTDDLKKRFRGGLKNNTGVYVMKVVDDFKNIEKETAVELGYEFLDTESRIDILEEAKLKYNNTFHSEITLNPKKLEVPLQMDQYHPSRVEYKIWQNWEIPLEYFKYGSSKIDFQSFCSNSPLSQEQPCVVTGVKDANTRTVADIYFYRKPGSAQSIFASIQSRPDMDINDPDKTLYKYNNRGEKKALYDAEFRNKYWKTNPKTREKEIILPIKLEVGNQICQQENGAKVCKNDSALLELNHSFGDWVFPDSEDGYDCDKLKKTKFKDGSYGFMGLSDLKAVQRVLLASDRDITGSTLRVRSQIAWKIGTELSLQQITKTLKSKTGKTYFCIDEQALLDNADGMSPSKLAEVLVSGHEGIQLEVGDVFYTEGNDFHSGRSVRVRTKWDIVNKNGAITAVPLRNEVLN